MVPGLYTPRARGEEAARTTVVPDASRWRCTALVQPDGPPIACRHAVRARFAPKPRTRTPERQVCNSIWGSNLRCRLLTEPLRSARATGKARNSSRLAHARPPIARLRAPERWELGGCCEQAGVCFRRP